MKKKKAAAKKTDSAKRVKPPAKSSSLRKKPSVLTSDRGQGYAKSDSVISRRNQNGTVILMVTHHTGSFFKLDGIAAEVWAALESPKTLDTVISHFKKRYVERAGTIAQDIEALVKQLVGYELLSKSTGPFDGPFPTPTPGAKKPAAFGKVREFDLLQIESEVLNESIYLDVFAGSDLKLKSDIAPIRNALEKVTQLDGITHRWNARHLPAGLKIDARVVHAGLIAQQVAEHMPELVRADKKTGHLGVEYQKLGSYLVEAIKELNQTLATQEKRIASLEKKLAASLKRR